MIVELYNEKTKIYECFNNNAKWIALTGYGKTKEEAKINYFKINILKTNNPLLINTNIV